MPPECARCHDCGVSFVPAGSETRCEGCRHKREKLLGLIGNAVERGHSNLRDIARETGFSEKQISKTIQASHYLAHAANSDETCEQCGERPAQKGSTFCLACRLALHKSLGDAATTTRDKQKRKKKKPEDRLRSMTTMGALSEKRRRTGSHRFNPAPTQRKGYR
jgi:hypothetical protein